MNRLGLEEMTPPKLETVNRRERRDFNYLDFLMKQFYLFRHAQSQANVGGVPLPDREIPLTELGQQLLHYTVPNFYVPNKQHNLLYKNIGYRCNSSLA